MKRIHAIQSANENSSSTKKRFSLFNANMFVIPFYICASALSLLPLDDCLVTWIPFSFLFNGNRRGIRDSRSC